ncbi:MAG: hypothetical protein Q9185_001379 [Variospora sp. 1 TL-2023]
MAARPLLRQRALVPTLAAACAITTLLYPRTTIHAEAPAPPPGPPQLSHKKPIYDDLPPLRSNPHPQPFAHQQQQQPHSAPKSPTDRLATQIRRARLTLHAYTSAGESRVNDLMSLVLRQERSFTSTIASLAPPPGSRERLMPGALYVLVAAMSGSILARNRTVLLRASVPLAVGVGAAWVVLPVTTRNVADLVWRYEEKVPVLAENHLRVRAAGVEGWKGVRETGERVKGWCDERVREGREAVEGWVRKG